jgi:DNA ligase (NAD+)
MDFDIDGMVLKIDDYKLQSSLGEKRSVPNWAIAYKFPQQEKLTILKSVEWLLGNKGNITPLAHIDTVNIFGADVSAATLHNCKEIERLDVKIGDHVIVTRRGDVIPKIIGVNKDMRDGTETAISIPEVCPACGQPITKTGVFIRCDNEQCQGRLAGRVENLVKALDIKNFGMKVIEKLVDDNTLKSPADIFKLVVTDISGLDRMGIKSAEKIINNINDARNASLDMVIAGLTIPGVGVAAGKDLADKYQTLDKFKDAKFDELVMMNDIGETTANNIISWLVSNSTYIDELIGHNIATQARESTTSTNKLSASVFAFTGKLSVGRKEMEAMIVDNGGNVSSINKTINYLIIGDNAVQTKIDKAKKYGAEVITETDFMNMIK